MKQFLIGVLVGILVWSITGEINAAKEPVPQIIVTHHNCLPDPFLMQLRHNPQLMERFRYFVRREYGWEFIMLKDSIVINYE